MKLSQPAGPFILVLLAVTMGFSATLQQRVDARECGGDAAILIRPMAYVTLTIDHRVVDGHQTNAWLTRFVEVLEGWPPA